MTPKKRSSTSSLDSSIQLPEQETSSLHQASPAKEKLSQGFYYLTQEARSELPKYQYNGADLSLLYHYVLSPLAAWCVDHLVPITVAPNTITLIGLLWMLTAYAAYWYYVPNLEIPPVTDNQDMPYPPQWIFFWNGVAMLAYQTLDNMDGKQARRTKSSSPLGLLFDHGCDAINSIFGSANWIIGMGLIPRENLLQCWSLVFGPFAMFYIATWEQYYTGKLILPIFNGPNEGLLGGALLSFTSWWYGQDYWQGTEWYDTLKSILPVPDDMGSTMTIRNCDFVITVACVGFVQEVVTKSLYVTRNYTGSMASLLPLFILLGCFLTIGYVEPGVWLSLPRTSLHLALLLFVEMSTDIMLAHVTAQTFHPSERWHLLPLMLLTVYVLVMSVLLQQPYDPWLVSYWIVAYTFGMASYLVFKIVLVIREMCTTLGIWCFDIVTPHPNAPLS